MTMSRVLALLLLLSPLAAFAGIEAVAPKDSVAGLKAALNQGATRAVAQLGVTDGFLKNAKVKIPLPPALKKADKALRMVGMGGQADELVVAMNRAAEVAVPEAKVLLVDAVKQMSLDDARQILTGGDDTATQYFRRVSYDKLQQRFLPIVKEKTDRTQLAKQYNELAAQAAPFGLVEAKDATVESYVTRKALDGLFFMIAEEERAIRRDPLGQSSKILRSVFGVLGR
ncbi:MAG TPA: DUF4197 domain-containing protein [Steroidobacteraceae bacterium]|nr:DUF4197 domain-containing protein [Steroidobacteraceae bacterium]